MIKEILKMIFGRKKEINYPVDFALIDFSPIALQHNLTDDENKIISRYYFNNYGNRIVKRYKYSEARVHALREASNIPVYDKTKQEIRFPVFAQILPSEVAYST